MVLAVANQKGGVGKTTLAVNLSAALALEGFRVLLLDLDPQGSATRWLLGPDVEPEEDITGLLEGRSPRPHEVSPRGLFLLPATGKLAAVERNLAGEVGGELVLDEALGAYRAAYDWVVLDCPPNLGILTLNGLAAAREVLVPVEPHSLAIMGIEDILDAIHKVQRRLRKPVDLLGLVLNRVDYRTRHTREVVDLLRSVYGENVLATEIRINTRIPESVAFARSVVEYDPASTGAQNFRALAREILEKVHVPQKA